MLFVIFGQNFTWLASTFMTLLSFGLIGVVLVKGDLSIFASWTRMRPKAAPYGRDVFGNELDWMGRRDDGLSLVKINKKGAC